MTKVYFALVLACTCSTMALGQPDEIPGAQPGKCYAKCLMPSRYESVTDQVMVRPSFSEQVVVPAQLETITDNVPVKEACVRYRIEPAVFETLTEKIEIAPPGRQASPSAFEMVQETILIKPAVKRYTATEPVFTLVNETVDLEPAYMLMEVLPQQYEEILERIETRPATTRWVRKKTGSDCLGAEPDDCFVWCLVEEPAQYEDIYKRVARGCDGAGSDDCLRMTPVAAKTSPWAVQKVTTPAQLTETIEPAEYLTLSKWVLKPSATPPAATGAAEYQTVTKKKLLQAARAVEEPVPAVTKPLVRKVLKAAARVELQTVPPEYTSVTKKKLLRNGGFSEWREIVCSEKLTGYTVRQIQEALRAMGYYKGTPDNTMNAQTKSALIQFQQDRSLPADGNVDYETLKALGVGY